MTKTFGAVLALAVSLLAPVLARATTVPVISYSMYNGNGVPQFGDNNYYDVQYSGGGGNIGGAFLSGGTGLLTNGIIPTTGYGDASLIPQYIAGTGPFVGWQYQDPIINFVLPGTALSEIDIYTNSVYTGLAGPPGAVAVTVNGQIVTTNFTSTAWSPYNSRLAIAVDPSWASATNISIQLFRGPLGQDSIDYHTLYPGDTTFNTNSYDINRQAWILVSEVEFLAAVPEPSTWTMMIIAFAGIGAWGYRRRKHPNTLASAS